MLITPTLNDGAATNTNTSLWDPLPGIVHWLGFDSPWNIALVIAGFVLYAAACIDFEVTLRPRAGRKLRDVEGMTVGDLRVLRRGAILGALGAGSVLVWVARAGILPLHMSVIIAGVLVLVTAGLLWSLRCTTQRRAAGAHGRTRPGEDR